MALVFSRKQIRTNKRLSWMLVKKLLLLVALPSIASNSNWSLLILVAPGNLCKLLPSPHCNIDYKSVTGPVRLIVLVPLLVVITFVGRYICCGDMVVDFANSSKLLAVLLLLLLLLLLFNCAAVWPVDIVTTLLLSGVCDFRKLFTIFSKL